MHKFLLIIALPLLLAACTHTTYEMVPPATSEGKACANTCLNTLSTCQARCQAESRMCEAMNFTTYGVFNRPMFDDDCNPSLCDDRCVNYYRACFTNCGGQVIRHTSQ